MEVPDIITNPKLEKAPLFCPPLEEIAAVLDDGLKTNFAEVKVNVVMCPDLTQEPFTLACKGLCGKPRLVEVGGVPYLIPLVRRDKLYDIKSIGHYVDLNPVFTIGAGAGPWPYAGVNCEMMVNVQVSDGNVNNHTRIAKVNTADGTCILERLPNTETRSALLANLFCCQGLQGKVLQVNCKKRTGTDDFAASIRKTLKNFYQDKAVGLGGTFLLQQGTAKQHIMPDFSKKPLHTDKDIEDWLCFYNQSAPLIAVGTLISSDPGLDLRVQHFHSFSHHGEGGHYHIDTDPDSVEYLGYFSLAEIVYRIDRPAETHQIGRD